jgi:hypothetical protein
MEIKVYIIEHIGDFYHKIRHFYGQLSSMYAYFGVFPKKNFQILQTDADNS